MRKIPTVYVRNPDDRRYVTDEVTPGCEWVLADEGEPTRKYDGTCVLLDNSNRWWARREVKPGKTPPPGFEAEERDLVTGKTVGWEPMAQSPFVKFHAEALAAEDRYMKPGTYELIGPKINGNPEKVEGHRLICHADAEGHWIADTSPADLVQIIGEALGWEGIVWHHPDGRMAKLKARDLPTVTRHETAGTQKGDG